MFSNLKNNVFGFSQSLPTKLNGLFKNKSSLDEEDIKELESCLISNDLGVSVTRRLLAKIKKDKEPSRKAIVDAMLDILKPRQRTLQINTSAGKPYTVLVVGVNGSGKTTTVAKLSKHMMNRGYSVAVVAADTFRAAAQEQLSRWAAELSVPVTLGKANADPASVVYEGYTQAKKNRTDVLIIDTAGRLHNQPHLMDELKKVKRVVSKLNEERVYETLLVIDSTMGRNAVKQAELFNQAINTIQTDGIVTSLRSVHHINTMRK